MRRRCADDSFYTNRLMLTNPRVLIGIPVFNEAKYVAAVLQEVRRYASDILVVDDGSTDATPHLLADHDVEVIRHPQNRGYGHSMQDMFRRADRDNYDWLITMDCDLQHEPMAIPEFLEAIHRDDVDVVSGSRYLQFSQGADTPPADRRTINVAITQLLNDRLGLSLTDAFCGFKAYRTTACSPLQLDVEGYEFPMQFWVQAVQNGLRISEIPVRLIYNDPDRSFGGPLDNPQNRREMYEAVFHRELLRSGSPDVLVRG